MTLSLTSRPAIRGRVIPRLPATMQAAGGLSVTKENGTWTLEPDWSQLPETSDATNQQVWVFNTVTEVYARMPVGTALDASKVAKTGDIMTGPLVFNLPASTNAILAYGAGSIGIEIGRVDGNASTPFIDFHSGATVTDFDARLIASGGGASSGMGTLSVVGKLTAAASSTSIASLNLPTGTAPSAPVDGDIWRQDNTNTGLKIRVNGVTKTITLS